MNLRIHIGHSYRCLLEQRKLLMYTFDGEYVPIESHKKRSGFRSFLSFVIMIAVVVLITILLRMYVFVPYDIPSGSMEETIEPGDMVFSEKVSYYFREPQAGDIVTFADPLVSGRTLIKRIIATEGQTVDFVNGQVVVDGVVLDEPYTNGQPSYPFERTAANVNITYPYTIPQGKVWVMGDNRSVSQDSRYFGAVDVDSIDGRASMIYWPLTDFVIF